MEQPPQRPQRPATPDRIDYAADATGLNSLPVDADAVDDLAALAASVSAPAVQQRAIRTNRPARAGGSSLRQTLIPLLLTGGLICLGLASAWWMTAADSPYRRVSAALPIVLALAGMILLVAACLNMLLLRRLPRPAVRPDRPVD